MRRIKDITQEEILTGKNWKLNVPDNLNTPVTEWSVVESDEFHSTDHIAYSAILVDEASGDILPLIQIKTIGDIDYGGEYLVLMKGVWNTLSPELHLSRYRKDYVANPLTIDPSFGSDWDFRSWHRDNFIKWSAKKFE